jgi:hypothetical protein
MVHVPAAMPVTTPDELTVAIDVLLLLHVPPAVESISVTVEPTQVPDGPVIGNIPDEVVKTVKYTRTKQLPIE